MSVKRKYGAMSAASDVATTVKPNVGALGNDLRINTRPSTAMTEKTKPMGHSHAPSLAAPVRLRERKRNVNSWMITVALKTQSENPMTGVYALNARSTEPIAPP